MSILLDEIEGGVSTGWEEGKSILKHEITCTVMRMFSLDLSDFLKCSTSKTVKMTVY